MKRWLFVIFIVVTFVSNAAIAMASGSGTYNRNEIITAIVALVCLSITIAFLISMRRN